MAPIRLDEEWSVLASFLPADWRDLARETGAIRRARGGIQGPDVLLQLLLMHVSTGLSLQQTVARARAQNLAAVSDVALLKRLRSSENWLREMAQRMFTQTRFARLSAAPLGRRLRAVDATTVEEPGATGTDWRVHFCLGIPDLRCDFFELTDVKGAETYLRIPIERNDVILGDRGYSHREGVAHVLRHGGDVVVRLNSTSFPLLQSDNGTPFPLLKSLSRLRGRRPGEWPVRFEASDRIWNARVCALRKSKVAAERAKARARKTASKQRKKIRRETLKYAEYVFVLTTLDKSEFDAKQILELYRARWQIELCFKRLKSILKLGHLPKTNDESARAFIQGKLLTVMLIEQLIDHARLFSPWGFRLDEAEPVARVR